jgi:hypothetical protein
MASGVIISDRGEVPERSNGAVLKTAEPKGSVGSNPTLSASIPGTIELLAADDGGFGWRWRPSPRP